MSTIFNPNNTVVSTETKLFLGKDSDNQNIQSYHNPKFPWIMEFAEDMRKIGNWSKNEIDLSKEKKDFDGMCEASQHIFSEGFQFAISLDSMAGRALLELFCNNGISNNPEWELYITNHQNNELLHSESYSEMVLAIFNDADTFINSITSNPAVLKRAKSILKWFNIATDIHDKYNANQICKEKGAAIPFPEIGEKERQTAIYLGLVVLNMFEGIRFFCTFATSWAFAEQPERKMVGSSSVFKLIARDEMIHLDIVQQVLHLLKTDKSEGFTEIAAELEETVYDMFREGIKEEEEWIDHLFSKGEPLIGLNRAILKKYMDYIFYIRMYNIGLDPSVVGLESISNPIPWINKYLDAGDTKEAPQEKEATGYVASISVDEDDEFDLDLL